MNLTENHPNTSAQKPPSCCQTSAAQHVKLKLQTVMWSEFCSPSGGQSDATETAQLVPQDAFLLHYWEERWQLLKWHKLSPCIVLNQSSRRALKRSAVYSQHGHNRATHEQHSPILPFILREASFLFSWRCCLYLHPSNAALRCVNYQQARCHLMLVILDTILSYLESNVE